ncbi:hypothetical protein PACTADRAFT_3264 [Pachysolen tannophilus NRRL Y-2460]|uniref:F-box domain-containing protein n=1 Tax=Pachysolen tannophilus NRRL Y-2460 TaxID=669874 RepID=A0A1E4TUZ1_PACTA|nr:hypothetical protein PACTADRAFT_3264 [Pachysolen tannophilus NRRL Y-2460]
MGLTFNSLPTEIQLLVISKADSTSLTQLLKTNHYIRELSLYTLNQKLCSLTGSEPNFDLAEYGEIQEFQDSKKLSQALLGLSFITDLKEKETFPGTKSGNMKSIRKKLPLLQSLDNDNDHDHDHDHDSSLHNFNYFDVGKNSLSISLYSAQTVDNYISEYETKILNNTSNGNSNISTRLGSKNNSVTSLQSINSLDFKKIDCDLKKFEAERENYDDDNNNNNDNNNNDTYSANKFNQNQDAMYSIFQLGSLKSSKNPLTKKIVTKNTDKDGLINLLVDEDSNTIKFSIKLSLSGDQNNCNMKILEKQEFFDTEWATTFNDEGEQFLISKNGEFNICFKLFKGGEVPPRSPYDYDCLTNYYMQFDSFIINNCYLLKLIEEGLKSEI